MVVSALLCSAIAYILVSPARALGGGLQAQLVDVRSKVEGPIDCKSICDPGGTPYNRNVEALQFLKRIWVPDDKNPINLTAVAKRRIFFGDGKFSLEYDEEEEVRNLAIKNPPPKGMVVTVQQMSCVLRCFKKLNGLFIDDSGVQGALQDLFLPEHLVELHMRDCPISGALTDLGRRSLLGLKLSSSIKDAISGDLKDLNVDRLQFLDFRGCRQITGNLADLKCSTLRGVFLQYTGVSGDITRLLRENIGMTWLDLRGTRVEGSINSEWRTVGQDLIHLRLSNTSVSFNMTEPELVQDRSKAPKPFPRLARLDLNGCPLNMDIWDLLLPLLYNEKLFWLEAEGCGLRGTIQDMRQYKLFPTYFGFYILDFSGNNITELAGRPKGDCSYDLSRNPLTRISEMYFSWPSLLNIRESGFNSEAAGSIQGPDGPREWEDVFEISDQSVRAVRNNNEGWECEWVSSRENPFFDLLISPKTFAPRHLCTCLETFEDNGTTCRKCPTGVTSIPDGDISSRSRCCACPQGKTSVSDSAMCYKCLGPGCTNRVCTGRCPTGYGGALCSYCANEYKRDVASKVCEKCARDGRFGGWTYAKYIGICGLWFAGLGGVLWYFVYHKVERFSGNELGQRKQECIEQSLLLLTFLQLLKTVRYAVDTMSAAGDAMSFFGYSFHILRTAVLLRIGDLLKLLDVECDFGHLNGLLVQRLSSALLLPTLCLLALAVGGCRGSPFFALRFCLFVMALLFPGTIEVTLSNLICVTADEEGLPLPEKDRFNQELPWVPCDSPAGFLSALLWIAFVLNAILLPLSILILARYMHREVEPLWLWSRWLRPSNLSSSSDGFTLRWDVPAAALVARSASGPAQGSTEQYTKMLQKSSQIFLVAHAAFLWESMGSPDQLAIETSFVSAGPPHADAAQPNVPLLAGHAQAMTLVVQCRIPDGWKDSEDAREAALRSVRPEAMALGEMLLYREASKRALKASGAKPLWIGARASFEKFSATDPLLFVGINKLVFFAIAGLCVNKNLAAVVISFLLLTIGVSRGDPHGTRSRNALGFVCCLSLTVYSCLLFLFEDFALSSIPQAAVVAVPTCYYLHLQLMPADVTIEAYSLLARLQGLDPAKEATPESPTIPTVEERTMSMVPRAKWRWEEHRFLRWLFHGYRQRVLPQLAISGERLMQIETTSLHGVGRMVRLLAGRGTVTQHPSAVELRTRAPG